MKSKIKMLKSINNSIAFFNNAMDLTEDALSFYNELESGICPLSKKEQRNIARISRGK